MQKLFSWFQVPEKSDFSIYNLPFGIFSTSGRIPRAGIAIGNFVIDLFELSKTGIFREINIPEEVFAKETLNDFIRLGSAKTRKVRKVVQTALVNKDSILAKQPDLLIPKGKIKMHIPVQIGDYTDFYSSEYHAINVGKLFRDPENALLPNWKHLPVAYHGRSSSVIIHGSGIHRPRGQIVSGNNGKPTFTLTKKLDYELELGFIVGKDSRLGHPISVANAEDHIFGVCLFNDWSARDIQQWEYVPLGPFLGKNFASSISPWIITMDALKPFRIQGPKQKPAVLPYLSQITPGNFDLELSIELTTGKGHKEIICQTNAKHLYWSIAQQLAHHTCNGCNVKVGDLLATGTISGPDPESVGSLLELSENGVKPVILKNREKRRYLKDGDKITLRGWSEHEHIRIGFGPNSNQILPARKYPI